MNSHRLQNPSCLARPAQGIERVTNEELRAYSRVHFALMASLGDAKAGERAVAAALLAFEGRFLDRDAFPSVASIGELAGLSERAVQGKLDALVARKRIVIELRRGCSSIYRVNLPGRPPRLRRVLSQSAPAESARPAGAASDLRAASLSSSPTETKKEKAAAARAPVTQPAPSSTPLPPPAAAASSPSAPTSPDEQQARAVWRALPERQARQVLGFCASFAAAHPGLVAHALERLLRALGSGPVPNPGGYVASILRGELDAQRHAPAGPPPDLEAAPPPTAPMRAPTHPLDEQIASLRARLATMHEKHPRYAEVERWLDEALERRERESQLADALAEGRVLA